MKDDNIQVVVPVFNKKLFVERSLCSIFEAAAHTTSVQIIVVDHGSTDGSLELGRQLCKGRARHIVHLGGTIASVRNAGARNCTGSIVSFLDSDCLVPIEYFAYLQEVLARCDVDATGCRVDYPENGPWVERVWHEMHRAPEKDGLRAYLNAGNFAVRRSAFEAVGGFDESLITGEDAEIGQRLNDGGFRIWESRRLVVLHLDNPRSIPAFYRKEVWHSLGMLATVRSWPPDRPVLMTVFHFVLLCGVILILCMAPLGFGTRILVGGLLAFLVPATTVIYRAVVARRSFNWLQGLLLYQVYFLARIRALIGLLHKHLIFKRSLLAKVW